MVSDESWKFRRIVEDGRIAGDGRIVRDVRISIYGRIVEDRTTGGERGEALRIGRYLEDGRLSWT